MANEKFNVRVNVGKIREEENRDLITNGDPDDIALHLLDLFYKAEVPQIKPEGFETKIVKLPTDEENKTT